MSFMVFLIALFLWTNQFLMVYTHHPQVQNPYAPEPYTLGLWESDVFPICGVFDEEKCVV